MSQFLERKAGEWETSYPKTAEALRVAAQTARDEDAPAEFDTVSLTSKSSEFRRVYSEIPLNEDLTVQREIIIERVAKPLGLNIDNALKQLSFQFPERKPSYDKFHLTAPLIVPQFKGVSWLDACDAADFYVSDYLRKMIKAGEVKPWQDTRGADIPDGPHGLWVQDGTQWVFRKPKDVRDELQGEDYKELLTGNLWRGFALGLNRWDMVEGKGWDLIGDSVGAFSIPYLRGWSDRPGFHALRSDGASPDFRAFVCGS